MDELLEQFLIESRDLIAEAGDDFAALARNPQATASIDSAFRAIHTLKGSVALFAMQPAEQALHAAEDVLDCARKGAATLDGQAIAALIACLDQVDRWIDQLENAGALAEDAPAAAAKLLALLGSAAPAQPAGTSAAGGDSAAWLEDLLVRDAGALAAAEQALTAFRYEPDADCFFRGDDPLAVVATVPELVLLAILPRSGEWPDADGIEPFSCFSTLEGLSAAPLERVGAAFRMMPDQVSLVTINPAERTDESKTERETRGNRTLRVDTARIDALGAALGELLVAVNGIAPLADQADAIDRALAADIRDVQAGLVRATSDLHRTVSAVRSVPLEPTLRRLPRLAREIAESVDKSIDFAIAGQGIEIDKQIADGLFEPLLHLLRNAIDHGIEAGERRIAAAKPEAGKISLSFARDGDTIVARLADDGAGIDPERIKAVALERGLLTAEAAETLSDAAALRLIFAPSFSTAASVTDLSGRGVGMDAVLTAVEALRGSIEIDSIPGQGTTFSLRLPASTLTTRLLVVEAGGDRYGVALDQIVETVGIENDKLMPVGSGVACVLHGRTVPVLDLAALLGGVAPDLPNAKLLVTRAGGEPVALRVSGFAERIDTLVRPSSGMLAAVPGVVGSTLLGDGGVLLVLDLPELAA